MNVIQRYYIDGEYLHLSLYTEGKGERDLSPMPAHTLRPAVLLVHDLEGCCGDGVLAFRLCLKLLWRKILPPPVHRKPHKHSSW